MADLNSWEDDAQQDSFSQTHPQQHEVHVIARRPSGGGAGTTEASRSEGTGSSTVGNGITSGMSSLSVNAESGAKILSIGSTASSAAATQKNEPLTAQDGSKVAAAKAIEKIERNNDRSSSAAGSSSAPNSGKSSPAPADAKPATREADVVAKEQAADVDAETLEEVYGKEHVNLIFIGHVDAGKSTLGGSILYATGMVDERTMDKYKREAKEAGRETWYLSWALDLTKEERAKGKTVEVGRGFFETDKRRYTILDAPGHKTFVPSMIGGASQADVGILVISARKGEYETGFEKGGQTREHAMLAKTQGVNKLIIVVNKMDDPTVNWSKERYDECTTKLKTFLRSTGYDPKNGTVTATEFGLILRIVG